MTTQTTNDLMFREALELLGRSLDVRDSLAEVIETASERLLTGSNPYRIAHVLAQTARQVQASNTASRDSLQAMLAILTEHGNTHPRPSEQGDPRGDGDNGR